MYTAGLTLLLLILILTGAISLTSLYNFERVLVLESNCDPNIQSLLGCPSGYGKEGSFAIASAKALAEDRKNIDIGIDNIDSTSTTSQVVVKNSDPKSNDGGSNIEPLIPSTINAIPFP